MANEPIVSKALITWLRDILPSQIYTPKRTMEEIMFDQGKLSLIEFLEETHNNQKNK